MNQLRRPAPRGRGTGALAGGGTRGGAGTGAGPAAGEGRCRGPRARFTATCAGGSPRAVVGTGVCSSVGNCQGSCPSPFSSGRGEVGRVSSAVGRGGFWVGGGISSLGGSSAPNSESSDSVGVW